MYVFSIKYKEKPPSYSLQGPTSRSTSLHICKYETTTNKLQSANKEKDDELGSYWAKELSMRFITLEKDNLRDT